MGADSASADSCSCPDFDLCGRCLHVEYTAAQRAGLMWSLQRRQGAAAGEVVLVSEQPLGSQNSYYWFADGALVKQLRSNRAGRQRWRLSCLAPGCNRQQCSRHCEPVRAWAETHADRSVAAQHLASSLPAAAGISGDSTDELVVLDDEAGCGGESGGESDAEDVVPSVGGRHERNRCIPAHGYSYHPDALTKLAMARLAMVGCGSYLQPLLQVAGADQQLPPPAGELLPAQQLALEQAGAHSRTCACGHVFTEENYVSIRPVTVFLPFPHGRSRRMVRHLQCPHCLSTVEYKPAEQGLFHSSPNVMVAAGCVLFLLRCAGAAALVVARVQLSARGGCLLRVGAAVAARAAFRWTTPLPPPMR